MTKQKITLKKSAYAQVVLKSILIDTKTDYIDGFPRTAEQFVQTW